MEFLSPTRFLKLELQTGGSPTPGTAHGHRLVAQVDEPGGAPSLTVFQADGRQLYQASVPLASSNGLEHTVEMGKEGVMLPHPGMQPLEPQPLLPVSHQHEIQQVALTAGQQGSWLGSVDCWGHACLHHIPSSHAADTVVADGHQPGRCLRLEPSRPVREAGWAGITLAGPSGSSHEPACATAMMFARQVAWFQGDRCTRCASTQQLPSAVLLLPHQQQGNAGPSAGLLACAEQNVVSIWDARQHSAVQRLPASAGGSALFSLAWCGAQGGMLGAAGAERAVILIDPRKWRVAHKWPGAAKYSIHYLQFSSVAPQYCYVAGLDYEFVAGRWDGQGGSTAGNANSGSGGHGRAVGPAGFTGALDSIGEGAADAPTPQRKGNLSFRGDSRWLGMAKAVSASEQDVVVASTQGSRMYVLQLKKGTA